MLRQCRMSSAAWPMVQHQKNYSRGEVRCGFLDLELPAGCPKSGSEEFEGTAYRVVRADPPTHEDLLTYLERRISSRLLIPANEALFRCFRRSTKRNTALRCPHLGNFVASVSLTADNGRAGVSRAVPAIWTAALPGDAHVTPRDFKVVGQ